MNRSLSGRPRGRACRGQARRRAMQLERLEERALLAVGDRPFGAMANDTGEYMLGDVYVSVVLMESDPTLAPKDNLPVSSGGRGAPVEDWTAASKAAVKSNIEAGLQWWEDTLYNKFPNAPPNLLNFNIDWTYLDSPVHTGFEPIDRAWDEFYLVGDLTKLHGADGWLYDFLNQVGFNRTGVFSTDIRAWNDFKRQQGPGYDWAYTIFVVNDANDLDKKFADNGTPIRQAFSFAGGQFAVVPSGRPDSSYSHETGHEFWALDEYAHVDSMGNPILGTTDYLQKRGYYNTQNLNAADNPALGQQAPSIMSNGAVLASAFAGHTSAPTTLEMIGWKDSDGDGIFDVLDVPFSLSGTGYYDGSTELYHFTGSTSVNTLPNQNTYYGVGGLQDDITINQVRVIEAKIDDEPWGPVLTLPPRTYVASNLDVSFFVPAGQHTVRIRSIDTNTGVMSPEFVGTTSVPKSTPSPGISGFVFNDINGNGAWDRGEQPFADFGLDLLDQNNVPVDLQRQVEPDDYDDQAVLNNVVDGAVLSAVGIDTDTSNVKASATSADKDPGAPKVFANESFQSIIKTWSANRQLRVDFSSPVGVVSILAGKGNPSIASVARLEAYDSQNQLISRVTSAPISGTSFVRLSVSSPTSNIAYVLVHGHAGTQVMLDDLAWGPAATTTTNTLGAYSLSYLPAGAYRVKATPPAGHVVTTPVGGIYTVTVAAGQSVGDANFGIHIQSNIWHNSARPLNVSGDAGNDITPLDALMVFNWLNSHSGSAALPQSGDPSVSGYLDVSNDGFCTPLDALLIFNYLNAGGGGEGETPPLAASASSGGSSQFAGSQFGSGQSAGEGEGQPAAPQTAAEYFAQNPVQFQIVGSNIPCNCAQWLAARGQLLAPTASSSTIDSGLTLLTTLEMSPQKDGASQPRHRSAAQQPLPAARPWVMPRQTPLLATRKDALSQDTRDTPPLEQTLDLIADDVSQAAAAKDAKRAQWLSSRG